MILLPAIDIIGGKPVRLKQGDYASASAVADDVLETALAFEKAGAQFVHLVDLDGAKAKKPCNQALIIETAKALRIPVEVGGGIRTLEDIRLYLDNGVNRVILGTAALQNPELVQEACALYPGRIAIGLDCRNGFVSVNGWLEDSSKKAVDAASEMEDLGADCFIVTDISKDGMLAGPGYELMEAVQNAVQGRVIASGGVSSIEDIEKLRDMGLYGAIAGKALYSKDLNLEEAIEKGRKC